MRPTSRAATPAARGYRSQPGTWPKVAAILRPMFSSRIPAVVSFALIGALTACEAPRGGSSESNKDVAAQPAEGSLAAIDRPAPEALEPFRFKIPATGVRLEFLPVPGTNHWLARTETTWESKGARLAEIYARAMCTETTPRTEEAA